MSDQTSTFARFRDSDMWWSFRRSPLTVAAALITLAYFIGAVFAPWVAPFDPFDVKALNLMDAFTPPARQQHNRSRSRPNRKSRASNARSRD